MANTLRRLQERVGHAVTALRARWAWFATALDVQKRYGEVHGNSLAAAVTLQAFLALFPLLLSAVALVGFISSRSADLPGEIIRSFGLTGDAATLLEDAIQSAEDSRRTASIVGLVGLLWAGLGLVSVLQYAYDQVWQVQERGLLDRAVALAWLAGAGIILLVSTAATAALGFLPSYLAPLGLALSLAINTALWLWTAKLLPNRDVGWRPLLPGALLGGVGLEVLKIVGAFYVPRLVASSSELYGSLGVVFAVLAWLLFFGRLLVYGAVLNVVLWERRAGTEHRVIEVPAAVAGPVEVDRTGRAEPTGKKSYSSSR